MSSGILSIEHLQVGIGRKPDTVNALRGVNLLLRAGVFTGLVGESGSGKTMSALSIVQLLPEHAVIRSGKIHFDGRDLLRLSETEMMRVRGKHLSVTGMQRKAEIRPLKWGV